jgi:hypothetical protein
MLRNGPIAVLVILLGMTALPGQNKGDRQYYSPWRKHADKPYYYRWYYFKVSPTDEDYQYHYGIYYPSRGTRVYLYNPHAKMFWGYYDMKAKGYALLPPAKRRQRLDDIPAEAFPEPGKMPPIPDAKDDTEMLRPPNDLPKPDDLPDGVQN